VDGLDGNTVALLVGRAELDRNTVVLDGIRYAAGGKSGAELDTDTVRGAAGREKVGWDG
jgi:hypothetical protein